MKGRNYYIVTRGRRENVKSLGKRVLSFCALHGMKREANL
jgi:hypothetical protein